MKKIFLIICFLLLVNSLCARTVRYQGLVISNMPDFDASSLGYNTLRFHVLNTSKTKHVVTLSSSTYRRLWKISKTATVEANQSLEMALYFPVSEVLANYIKLEVDGRLVDVKHGYLDGPKFNYARDVARLFIDSAIPVKYFEVLNKAEFGGRKSSFECVQFTGSDSQLYRNWIAYAKFRCIFYRAENFELLSEEVKTAIFDYVRLGGMLTIIGKNMNIPEDFRMIKEDTSLNVKTFDSAYGRLFLVEETDSALDPAYPISISSKAYLHILNYASDRNYNSHNLTLSSKEALALEPAEFAGLVLLFAILLGPINIYWLARKKKMILIFVTVPLISFVLCFTLGLYYYLFESDILNVKNQALIYLNESTNKAYTLANYCVFSAKNRPEGFKFGEHTAVYPVFHNQRYPQETEYGSIILDSGQHFAEGWIRARTIRAFKQYSVDYSREKVIFKPENGNYKIINGLGVDINEIIYLSENKQLYIGNAIGAGKTGLLSLQPKKRYRETNLFQHMNRRTDKWFEVAGLGVELLRPGQYYAKLASSPFLKQDFDKKAKITSEVFLIGNSAKEDML